MKSPSMLGGTPRGLSFLKKKYLSGILRHAHSEEIALLLIFAHSGDSQETFRRLQESVSEDSQETLRKLSEAARMLPGSSREALTRLSAGSQGTLWPISVS